MSSRGLSGVRAYFRREGCALLPGARHVLLLLADECDDNGDSMSCEAAEEALAAEAGAGVSTVRRHLSALCDHDPPLIDRSRRKNPDGTWGGYRTWLCLENLGIETLHRSKRAVDGGVVGNPVDNPDPSTAQNEPATAQIRMTTAQIERSIRKDFLPSFLHFHFRDEAQRDVAARILSVCGPGLAGGTATRRILMSLTNRLDEWLGNYDLELDILPVVEAKTAKSRRSLVCDLMLFDTDIEHHRRQRKRDQQAAAPTKAGLAPPRDDDERLQRLTTDLTRMDMGMSPIFAETRPEESVEQVRERLAQGIRDIEAARDAARERRRA